MQMRRWVGGVMLFAVACIAARAEQPGAAGNAKEKERPFWQLPRTTLDLKALTPAAIKFVAGPEIHRGLAVLQTSEEAPPVDFVPSANPDLQPFLPQEDAGYQVVANALKVGAAPFGDRGYRIEKLPPAFARLTLLRTKMGHKAIVDGRYAIVVSAAKPCLVFVALDQRVLDTYGQHGTPAWLQEFVPTGEKIKTDDPIMAQTDAEFHVFVRQAAPGRIVFGPPAMDIQYNAMYFAFFGEGK